MLQIRLETHRGGFVLETQIPPFAPPPGVVVWGSRVFILHRADLERMVYSEALAFFLPAGTPSPVDGAAHG